MSNSSQTLECPKITIFSDVLTTLSGPFESPRSQGPVFFQLKKTPFHLLPPGRSHDLAASDHFLWNLSSCDSNTWIAWNSLIRHSLFSLELKQRRRQVTQMPLR